MEVTDAQKKEITGWVEQGLGLSDIQKKMASELGLSMTYMEVRFLVDDLKLKLRDKAKPSSAPASLNALAGGGKPEPPARDMTDRGIGAASAPGPGVAVEVDRVTKPGAVVSGSVRFSDGARCTWMLDDYGRLALGAEKPGYRPSAADVKAFQEELGAQLQQRGF